MIENIRASLQEAQNALKRLLSNDAVLLQIESAAQVLIETLEKGYRVFSRYLEGHGITGDSLIAISTSGCSPSVLNAAKTAKSCGIKVIALTGNVNPELKQLSDVYVCTSGGQFADRIQELHIKVLHILIEMVERHFHPENYET